MVERQESHSVGSSLMVFILGVAVGATVAILYAPTSGTETRAQLATKADELKDKAVELKDQAVVKANMLKDTAVAKIQTGVDSVRDKVQSAADDIYEAERTG